MFLTQSKDNKSATAQSVPTTDKVETDVVTVKSLRKRTAPRHLRSEYKTNLSDSSDFDDVVSSEDEWKPNEDEKKEMFFCSSDDDGTNNK